MHIDEVFEAVRPVHIRASIRDLHMSPPLQWGKDHEQIADAVAFIFIIIGSLRETPPFRAGRKGGGAAGARAEPSGRVEAPAFTERPVFDRG